MHLKNDYKPRLPCNNTQFSSIIGLEKDIKRKYADFFLILGAKKGAVHLIPSQNAFFYVINESKRELRKSERTFCWRLGNKYVSNTIKREEYHEK